MANIFEGKVELPEIRGSSTINHQVRVELGLTCSEYVFMDYVHYKVSKKEELDIMITYIKLGFTDAEQQRILFKLIEKGFIFPESVSPPKITDKWISAFKDLDTEFENYFWKINSSEFKWSGSKKKAKDRYKVVRKKYSKDFIINQRDWYVKFLYYTKLDGFDRGIMMAERWLNPANEYYLSDWKGQTEILKEKLIKKGKLRPPVSEKASKPLTDEERRKQYAQDSNQ